MRMNKILQSGLAIVLAICQLLPGGFLSEAALAEDTTMDGTVRVYLSSLGSPSRLDITIYGSYSLDGSGATALANGSTVTVGFNKFCFRAVDLGMGTVSTALHLYRLFVRIGCPDVEGIIRFAVACPDDQFRCAILVHIIEHIGERLKHIVTFQIFLILFHIVRDHIGVRVYPICGEFQLRGIGEHRRGFRSGVLCQFLCTVDSGAAAGLIACVCRMKTPPYSTGFRTTLPAGNAVSQAMEHCIMA